MDLQFDLKDGRFVAAVRQLANKDIQRAASWALNDTAKEVQASLREQVAEVFDRATPFALNAFGVNRGARPTSLEVELSERPSAGRRHFLKVQEHGGARPRAGLEQRFAALSPDPVNAVVPTEHARLDRYGNWSMGERNQVLSQLKIGRDVGFASNETDTSKARKVRRKQARYFVPKHGLAPGVYRRNAPDDIPLRILTFTSTAPVYTPTLKFAETAQAEFWARLPDHLSRTLGRVVAKSS